MAEEQVKLKHVWTTDEFWNKCKARAAEANIDLMSKDGWIVQAMQDKYAKSGEAKLDWTTTDDFRRQARQFCKSEGWIEPQTLPLETLPQLKLKELIKDKDFRIIGEKICLGITGINKLVSIKVIK